MRTLATRLLLTLLCCLLPTFAAAATSQNIHVEWDFTAPSKPGVTGFKLYQDGVHVCQTQDPMATTMDCTVSANTDTAKFTLTATFSDGTESPHSSPFPLTSATDSSTSTTTPTDSTVPDTTTPDPSTSDPATDPAGDDTSSDPTSGETTTTDPVPGDDSTTTDPATGDTTTPIEPVGTGSHLFTFTWESTADPATLAGYRIYLNNSLLCETNDPTATTLACKADLVDGTMSFGLTSVFLDGTESSLSNLLTYTPSDATSTTDPTSPTDTTALNAAIAAAPRNGTAPLTISFNAGSSTGSITSAQWNFGDGTTGTGTTTSHVFTEAGNYTVTLTVADSQGLTSTATVAVSVASAAVTDPAPEPTPATPPSAVISSSTAMGPATLQVTFDGTGSKAASGASITGYAWSFGDGSTTTGASAAHSYTKAGTYTASLTVTDTQGLTNSASTPIVVTAPVVVANKPPTAAATATPTSGTAPLTVSFDGSQSADSDGSIATYLWDFGDGSTADGKTASHTYIDAGDYTAILQVTDDKGATDTTAVTIKAEAANELAGLNIETGEISVGSTWVRVELTGTFTEPVVIAGPPSTNDTQPCVIRVRNVTPFGFEIRLAEWNYLDGTHPEETVSYLVMDKGRTTLPDGTIVEAGSFAGTPTNQNVRFSGLFNTGPVVLTTIASENEIDTIGSRTSKISTASFAYYFKEQEKNKNQH
ncbi:MAG: PKD domain-containing protein, partial [Desulfobulbus sp.]|nr:PKD domain-containing protein [Desulfobulbus sp.]